MISQKKCPKHIISHISQAELGQLIEITTKKLYVQLQILPKPQKFYTIKIKPAAQAAGVDPS